MLRLQGTTCANKIIQGLGVSDIIGHCSMSFDHLTLFKIIQDLEGDPPRLLVSHMNYSMGSLHSQLNV